ncbi:UNVERIFIED_CONTAM: Serine/threonine-protein phosphatase 7 long form [Sesamum calycinum]|uniref:Serine/threonine-protein phosphatase 7 long form n=1 Tax=Sesamum calycinum TaxID=2727403 RepID=A0AAW2LTS6_9LAMI
MVHEMELYYHNNHNTGPMTSFMVTLMRSCKQNVPTVNFGKIYVNKTSPFVQQILHQIGFYGVYRCGRIQYDRHLITALVERWRSETHSFYFRVGEATITLQDVQVIWGLPIDGESVSGTDLERTSVQWQEYCMQYIGLAPEEGALKGSRLQYARAVALLLLGGTMCPDSSGNLVSLLYLAKLEDIVAARNNSWGSAVLAFLYCELCNASEKGKAAIGGALQLSRIIPLYPGLGAPRVQMGPHQINSNRVLPGTPYGAIWNCEHTFTRIVRTTVRVIRDILDEMQYDQPDTRDMSLHKITRSNRTGTDWVLQHILYITRWQRRYDTVIQRQPISNRRDTDRGYWEWYNNITRHFVSSSTDRHVESGYQPVDAPMLQIVPQQTATPSDTAPTTSHRERRSSSQMSNPKRGDIGVDIAGPSTAYTLQDYYVPQPPQDYYVPQPSQDDWFQSTSYMPSHAEAYSSHVDLDLGLGIN